MNKILLIDVDSTIPNIALMKLSTYYKKLNFKVELIKCNISYYPKKQKIFNLILDKKYEKVFISAIFNNTLNFLNIIDDFKNELIYGGTGYNINLKLPKNIYNVELDYTIYPENDISYDFITRGCVRNCYFCVVPKKEGKIYFNKHPKDIIKHKKVKFLDNNILSYSDHKNIFKWLAKNKIKCQFNQGLDIRLIDNENSKLLSQLKYINEYIFAFDDWKIKEIIIEKLNIMKWRKDWQFKFFVYVNPKMEIEEIKNRIEFLYNNKCLPYVMRDILCWDNINNNFYIDLASWCNQPNLFKKMSFNTFLEKRHTKIERINNSKKLWATGTHLS